MKIGKCVCFAGLSIAAVLLLTGCVANKENVLAVTSTVIGVQIHQKDADKTPELKVGYARAEFAFVPTDKRSDTNSASGSAANSAEVLMEINAQGNVGLGTAYQGGIYQRLAVGKTAVQQPGAAFMMAKDASGNINNNTATAIANATKAVNTIPESKPAPTVTRRQMVDAYNSASVDDRKKFDTAAKQADSKYSNFNDFISSAPDEDLKKFTDSLNQQGVILKSN
jgi:hypothetical protein